ncbi:MAG: putative ABC exporter domain-containing protein, partial [Clostridiales Family XIII bacterium]|nr:putative ABC exporter domain-containing protein [Clostridiales Family XIII bacterium]
MSALVYIVRKSVKNSLKELLKKPCKLALYVLVAVAIIGLIFLSSFTRAGMDDPAPLFWFSGILFLFVTMFVVIAFSKGLSAGDAIFDMNDVNLLFVSPLNPRKVLLYGLVRMAKTSFLASFFILFQATSLALFGVDYGGVLLTFACFLLAMIVLTTVSLLIYSVTNGNAGRKRIVKGLAVLLFMPLAVFLAAEYFTTQDMLSSLETAINSPFLRFVPVAGWTASGVTAFLSGEAVTGVFFLALNLLLCAGIMAYILLSNPDYYEDVLVATETAYEKKRAMADGNLNTAASVRKSVKVAKTGIPGNGAAALFGKHMRESFRENRFGVLTLTSVLVAAGAVIVTLFVRELSVILQILMWMQIFLIGTGRGLKETYSHYIYMIPESSFKKILWGNMEIMVRTLLESILVFGIGGALVKSHPMYILICILAYTLFSLLLLGVNYLSMRFLGADVSMGLLIVIYYLAVVLAMAQGLALAIVIG